MRRRAACLLLFLSACATAPPRPLPSANTPPPPQRPENVVTAYGIVRDPAGALLEHARLRAWEADDRCDAIGGPVTRHSGAGGTYEITVGRRVGPQFEGCVVLEVAAGGAVALLRRNAHFAPETTGLHRQRIDVTLPPARLLDRAEADRLVAVVRRALHEGAQDAVEELALYTRHDYTPYRRRMRGISAVRLVSEGEGRFVYELSGTVPETSVTVTIEQNALTRISFS